jgi:hypothetical protein
MNIITFALSSSSTRTPFSRSPSEGCSTCPGPASDHPPLGPGRRTTPSSPRCSTGSLSTPGISYCRSPRWHWPLEALSLLSSSSPFSYEHPLYLLPLLSSPPPFSSRLLFCLIPSERVSPSVFLFHQGSPVRFYFSWRSKQGHFF